MDHLREATQGVAEAPLLEGLSPEEVRGYHEVKVYCDGIIEQANPNESRIMAKRDLRSLRCSSYSR